MIGLKFEEYEIMRLSQVNFMHISLLRKLKLEKSLLKE